MWSSKAVWVGGLAVALVVLPPLLASAGVLTGMPGLLLFASGALVGFVAVAAGAVALLRGRMGAGALAVGLGLAAMAAVLLSVALHEAPAINDVTTDLEAPPVFSHARTLPANAGKDLGYPKDFGPVVRRHYAHLKPLLLPLSPDEALALVERTASAMPGWKVTAVDRQAGTLEAAATTRVFRFEDDVVVRVRPEGEGSRVDVRSRSRVLKGDLGANARRIEDFLRALAARAPALARRGGAGVSGGAPG